MREGALLRGPTWWAVQRFLHLKVNSRPIDGLFVSPAAIKFTVMWLLMSVFLLSAERIESTDATEDT